MGGSGSADVPGGRHPRWEEIGVGRTPLIDLSHLAPDLDLVPAPSPEDWGVIPWPGIDPDTDFSFDEQPQLEEHSGPSPSLILQVIVGWV